MEIISSQMDKIQPVLMLLASAIVLRSAVVFTGQTWIKTFSHTLTLLLLPIVTYALTSVISGNIALSLGMVGALSIVRFRNPVKSPLELVVYFLMISCGIAAAVSTTWLALLVGTALFVLVGAEMINRLSWKLHGRPVYSASFTEGNSMNTLEVYTEREFQDLLQHADLMSFVKSPEGNVYRFANPSRQPLLDLSETLDGHADVTRVAFSSA